MDNGACPVTTPFKDTLVPLKAHHVITVARENLVFQNMLIKIITIIS